MQAESLLAASSTQGVAQLCDPRSGALQRTLKDCRACGNGLCASEHFVATAERDRSFVHLWSWGKEQPHFRCQAPERLTCIAATADGAHCFAGAASGKLYLWQVASGRLLLAWHAHFKAATALSLCSDNFLLSAGEDAIVLAWNVAQLLQAAAERIAPPPAMRTWTAHTLPVTSLVVAECGVHSLIASASLDQTVRVWRLADSVRECVHCVDFASPLACLAAHPLHVSLYAGGTDGRIYPMPLLQPPHDSSLGAAAAARPPPAATAHDEPVRSLCSNPVSCPTALTDPSPHPILPSPSPHLIPRPDPNRQPLSGAQPVRFCRRAAALLVRRCAGGVWARGRGQHTPTQPVAEP
jgi:pre-rRNA-processing protein IPI3